MHADAKPRGADREVATDDRPRGPQDPLGIRRDGAVYVAARKPELRPVLQRLHVHRGPVRAVHRQRGPQGADRLNEDPDVAAEAEAFLRQEAQHAAAHRKHMLPSCERYPELEQCYEFASEAYDELIDEQPIEFHAAYIANLEATFTPLFKVILDNRDSLFGGGDQRVASLMMWHFVEEIEHRSSGLILYRHINPDRWYRVQTHSGHLQHVGELSERDRQDLRRGRPVRGPRCVRAGADVELAAVR